MNGQDCLNLIKKYLTTDSEISLTVSAVIKIDELPVCMSRWWTDKKEWCKKKKSMCKNVDYEKRHESRD